MKKKVLLTFILLATINSLSAISVITGKWNLKGDKVTLFKIDNGQLKEIATSGINADKEFGFAINHSTPQFYVIGVSPTSPVNNQTFYLKPDDHLRVEMSAGNYNLVGDNSSENKELERWHNLISDIESKAIYFMKNNSTYVDFFPLFENKLTDIEVFRSESDNIEFNKQFDDYRKFDLLKIALFFLQTPRNIHPEEKDYPDYYNKIKIEDITATDAILHYPYGVTVMRMAKFFKHPKKVQNSAVEDTKKSDNLPVKLFDTYLSKVINKEVKGEIVLDQAKSVRTYDALLAFQKEYEVLLATDRQKQLFKDMLIASASNAEGQNAFDFKFKDINGKEVSLSDFKGKLVYVDVWATWCGPCKKELPYLKQLEKEYKGKDIVFIGVSIDDQKSYNKWKEFIVSENMPGIQVFAGDQKENITKPYKIKGIPRFMLFSKDGRIITTEAPRPSSDEIKIIFNSRLKK